MLYILANCAIIVKICADVVELADTQDLGSCARACRFKSCHPHHKRIKRTIGFVFLYTAVTDLRQCRLHCRQTLFATCPAMQLPASEERRKRKAFADIKHSGHSKQIKHVVSVQSTVVRQAQFVLRRRFTVANKFARFAITFALLTTSPVVRTKCNGL